MTPEQLGLLGTAVGGIFGGLSGSGDTRGSQGYTGGIPDLTATRTLVPGVFGSTYTTPTGELAPRRPGSSGRRYFTDVKYDPVTDAAGLPTIMGAAEFQAANQAALAKQQELTDLGLGILGTYEQNLANQQAATTPAATTPAATTPAATTPAATTPAATTPAATTTDLTGGATTLTGGATTPTAYDTFADSLRGRQLTAADAAAIAASGYSLNDLASTLSTATTPIDALALRNFINTYTSGSTTTDDGKVGSVGMRNLLVNELGYTENADGTLTDPTNGTIYGLTANDTWAPRAATTTDTTLTGGATTPTAYDTFADSLRGRQLTAADAAAIAASGYSLNDLASTLSTATTPIDALALRNFINTYTSGSTTTDDGKVGSVGMRNLLVNELGYTENADGTITDRFGTTYSVQDGAWRPVAGTTDTTTTGTNDTTVTDDTTGSTRELTEAELKQAVLDGTMSYKDAYRQLNIADAANPFGFTEEEQMALGIHESQRTGQGYKYNPTTGSMDLYDYDTDTFVDKTGTTVTDDTTGADAVDTLLNSTEQYMVSSGGYTDNGDGTVTDNTNGYVYDNDTGEGYFPTTADTTTADTTTADTTTADTTTADTTTADTTTADTTTADTTTTDTTDSNAAFNTFISPFYNSELTPAQLIALGDSGYDLSTIASTLKVDATALSNAIAQATSAAQIQSIFDAIDPSDISRDDADSVANLILEGKTGIDNVAEQFENISGMDVVEGMLRGGYESPAALTERLAPYNTDFTEVELMASLLSQGRATPEELAAYYGNNPDYPEYAAVTADDVREFAKGLGIEGYAQGGNVNGYYLGGPTDGMADQIPATIDNRQPAALSDGEFVIPADVVSHLGNGNSDAGAKNLYSMMERVRTDRTGNPNQGKQINPNQYLA